MTATAATPHDQAVRRLGRAPLIALAGALTIAFSAILVRQATCIRRPRRSTAARTPCRCSGCSRGASAAATARAPTGQQRLALLAGLFFAADLIFWHQAIADVGAGLATVLGNLQVVIVPFVAWAVLSEAPGRRILAALPLTLIGVVLISGALEDGAYGAHPARGVLFGALTGVAYGGLHPDSAPRQRGPAPAGRSAVRRDLGRGARVAGRRAAARRRRPRARLAVGRLADRCSRSAPRCSAGC